MKGKPLKIFYKSTVVENVPPSNFKKEDLHLFQSVSKISIPESGLFHLKNVFVTDLGIIYKNFSSLKENIICYDIDFRRYRFRYFLKSLFSFKKRYNFEAKSIIIFDNYSGPNGFAHWICDGLTRLAELNDILHEYTIVVPFYFKDQPVYSESLKLFNTNTIYYLPKHSLTFFRELFFPTPIGDTGNFHPENIKKLRKIVQAHITLPAKANRNIYISRAKAKRRFVQNEEEVVKLLTSYGFETVYLEDYLFPEQVKILNGAANVISIHGAALSTIMFMQERTSVLELRGKNDATNNMYYLLANVCQLHYYYLSCNDVERSKAANNFDLNVNLNDLANTVQLMLAQKQQT